MPEFMHIHPEDNVAVALHGAAKNTVFQGVTAGEDIPQGHKMALKAVKAGDPILKYGFSIGHATEAVTPGQWVHTHNMKTNLSGEVEYTYNPKITHPAPAAPATFRGFRRRDGKVGIRNEIWIINTVGCVNKISERLAKLTGAYAFPHPFGCSQLGVALDRAVENSYLPCRVSLKLLRRVGNYHDELILRDLGEKRDDLL